MSVWTLVEEYVKFFCFFFNQRYQSHLWQSDQLLIKTNVKKKKPLCYIYAIKKNNNPHLLPKSQNLVLWVYNADQRGSNVKEKRIEGFRSRIMDRESSSVPSWTTETTFISPLSWTYIMCGFSQAFTFPHYSLSALLEIR